MKQNSVLVASKLAIFSSVCFLEVVFFSLPASVFADAGSYSSLSLEELMDIEITSVSKKPQKLSKSAAAVFVITKDDILRSGATNIPEVLRMVPGLHVAKIDASRWAISARGNNGLFANKLLVLIDGRSVYTPLFSGVFWEEKDTLLQDIKRIEVIRGPGASLWGANAVNGVINIITENANDTQGGLVTTGGGSEVQGFGGARYGGKLGEKTAYRLFAKYDNYDNSVDASGEDVFDRVDTARGGFRIDATPSEADRVSLQGNIFDGKGGFEATVPTFSAPFTKTLRGEKEFQGGSVLGLWGHKTSETSDLALQLYYDRIDRNDIINEHQINTYDADFQHNFKPFHDHQFIWGVSYRYIDDSIKNTTPTIVFAPTSRDVSILGGFLQDEISLVDDTLALTLGTKLENNHYTGFEVQPTARVLWTLNDTYSLWGAFSRAVRTPSRSNEDNRLILSPIPTDTGATGFLTLFGNNDVDSEELLAYELGFRAKPTAELAFDVVAFFHQYNNLVTFEPGTPFFDATATPPHLVIPLDTSNLGEMDTYGVELVVDWKPIKRWRMQASYSYRDINPKRSSGSLDANFFASTNQNPANLASLRSLLDIGEDLKFDGMLRYVDSVSAFDVDSYIELDLRLGWAITSGLDLSVVGQNLLDNHHAEYVSNFVSVVPAEIERAVYGRLTWTF